jgi:uncharacterized protein YndB with AHSA1/START domain
MKIIKKILIVLAVFVGLVMIYAAFAPDSYIVERSRTINAPINVVFEKVAYFKNWDSWSPWKEKDQTSSYAIDGTDGTVGAKYSWTGDPEKTGKGSMTVTEYAANKKFAYDLSFTEPWEMSSKGYFTVEDEGGKTKLTWADEGDIPFMQRPMMLFFDLDAMMGPDFERGLFKIDSLSQL